MMRTATHWLLAFTAAISAAALLAADTASRHPLPPAVPDKVPVRAQPFALCDVRLLDSPFSAAMRRDAEYLLDLEPDRLLHTFRLNAGLPSSAEPLGGWEEPKCELRGHFLGHYLSACALMYASTGDRRLKERADGIVATLAECQRELGTSGYLSAFPESFLDRVEKSQPVWAPWYTLHKILAGLLDVHTLCGNAQALDVARRFGDWVKTRTDRLSDEQMERMLAMEHGGINEALANLYAATGEERYLQAARRFYHQAVLDPLARGEDQLAGKHANTQFPKVIGTARLYEVTGDAPYRSLSEFFWARVVHHHSYVIGGNSDREHFGEPDKLNERVSPWTVETCNTHNMLKLTRHLFAWHAEPAEADYYERALYNQILASQDPQTGMMAYHFPLFGSCFRPYNTPRDSFWCCTGTGIESHAKYGDGIYWHDADGLFVNLFIPSVLSWKEKGVTLRQETRFPEADTTRLELACQEPVALTLRIRHPAWAERGVTLQVNGEPVAVEPKPGSYIELKRTWRSGDRVEVQMPFSLRTESMPDNPHRLAILYGPIVLAGKLGTEGIVPPMPYAKSQGDFFHGPVPPAPVLVTEGRPVTDWIEAVPDQPLTFRSKGVGRPADVTLTALYQLHHERYTVYWDALTPAQWQERQAELEAAARREREMAARTIDRVAIGDPQSESAHQRAGEGTNSGTFQGRAWRDAPNGDWFSFVLQGSKDQPAELICTYWGSDRGGRKFDILADGQPIATQELNNNRPGEFFDAVYPLPPELVKGRTSITVRFQAHPSQIAGGLFDLRLLRSEKKE